MNIRYRIAGHCIQIGVESGCNAPVLILFSQNCRVDRSRGEQRLQHLIVPQRFIVRVQEQVSVQIAALHCSDQEFLREYSPRNSVFQVAP